MKKTLWGYEIRAVDEEIENLETEIYKLTQKIKKLENERSEFDGQLEKLNGELKSALDGTSNGDERLAIANAQIEALKKEAEIAKKEASDAKALLAKTKSETVGNSAGIISNNDDNLDSVSEICRTAYADMVTVKSLTREKMIVLLQKYAEGWSKSNAILKKLIQNILDSKERAREAFIFSADEILKQFTDFDSSVSEVSANIAEYENSQAEIIGEFKNIISNLEEKPLVKEKESDIAQESVEQHIEEPEEGVPAILREIKTHTTKSKVYDNSAEFNAETQTRKPSDERENWVVLQNKAIPEQKSDSPMGAIDVALSVETKDIFG